MKFKLLVKAVEMLLGDVYSDEKRANTWDMYQTMKVLSLGLILTLGGAGFTIYGVLGQKVKMVVIAIVCLFLGIWAIVSWKNETIKILSEETFEYTNLFGKTKMYRFADITGLKEHRDSVDVMLGQEKVHIDSNAVMSEKLIQKLRIALSGKI
ncbi:MAG: hypothetical protein Q4B26_05855 [Eubacteriales bacterium]|nr:hypothetical protein [Eubacteriales bacterium]